MSPRVTGAFACAAHVPAHATAYNICRICARTRHPAMTCACVHTNLSIFPTCTAHDHRAITAIIPHMFVLPRFHLIVRPACSEAAHFLPFLMLFFARALNFTGGLFGGGPCILAKNALGTKDEKGAESGTHASIENEAKELAEICTYKLSQCRPR